MDENEFCKYHSGVKRGDIVGICGFPGLYTSILVGYMMDCSFSIVFLAASGRVSWLLPTNASCSEDPILEFGH